MTFREKLADWISGGALTQAIESKCRYKEGRLQFSGLLNDMTEERNAWRSSARAGIEEHARLSGVLERIANMETEKANATVRRMANAARDALNGGD